MYDLSASIVLYHNGEEAKKAIQCVLNTFLKIKLYLIDNSETDTLKTIVADSRIEYIFNDVNIGYGSAHNIAIKKSLEQGIKYHLIMNPDITFVEGTLENIHQYMETHPGTGSLMPNVFFEDGSLQRLCKLLPTPFNLFGRRFLSNTKWAIRQNEKYELHHFKYDKILNTPCLSGCFMFARTAVLLRAGLFDPRYFMYLEDYDLNRRIYKISSTIFYPEASIIHGHKKESYKNGKLLKIHIQSAIKYFNKWGWFYDKDRFKLNNEVLKSIE